MGVNMRVCAEMRTVLFCASNCLILLVRLILFVLFLTILSCYPDALPHRRPPTHIPAVVG